MRVMLIQSSRVRFRFYLPFAILVERLIIKLWLSFVFIFIFIFFYGNLFSMFYHYHYYFDKAPQNVRFHLPSRGYNSYHTNCSLAFYVCLSVCLSPSFFL